MTSLSAFEIYHLTKKRQFFFKTYAVRQHVAFFANEAEMLNYFNDNLLGKNIVVSNNCVVIAVKSSDDVRIVLDVNKNYFNRTIYTKSYCNRILSTMLSIGFIVKAGKDFKW